MIAIATSKYVCCINLYDLHELASYYPDPESGFFTGS